MYALVIGRTLPDIKTGMMGIFEFEQAVALNKHGFRSVYAFCDNRSIKSLRVLNYVHFEKEIPVYGYHFPIGGLPRKIFEFIKASLFNRLLKKILRDQGKPLIVHIHFPLINLNTAIWGMLKKLEVPIVVTEHWSKVQSQTIEPYRVELLKKIVNESDSFNCVGDELKKSVIELTNTSKDIQVTPNMIQPIFNFTKEKGTKNRFDFISIGRLVETKRFDLLIEAFSKAFYNQKDVYLNIVGDGPLNNQLKLKIQELNMADRIILHGFLSRKETAELLKKSDVFVSASVVETFGVPFIEALACGKPVVGFKGIPISRFINKSNGVLFNKDDLNSLSNSLIKVYSMRSVFDNKNISEEAQNIFGEESVVKQLINIYNRQIGLK